MNPRVLTAIVAGIASACASAPEVDPEVAHQLQSVRSVYVKVEYWPGLRELAETSLKGAVAGCSSPLTFAHSEEGADLTVHYFHLQAICLDCNRQTAPVSFEVSLLRGDREIARWKRRNVGCGQAECMLTRAMRGVGELLCSSAESIK